MKILTLLPFVLLSCSVQGQLTQQWASTFNGTGDFSDYFTCLTSDGGNAIYAGGYSQTTDENADFLIAKFNTSGQLLWKKTWRGSGQGPDIAYGIAYSNGTVYATGEVSNTGVGFDFFTIAVSANGDSIWGAHYNDPAYNQYDQANAIAIDNSGNILVTGESDRDPSSITNDDFLTIKYDSNGAQVWIQRFNGSGNNIDRAVAIDTDASGNVFVAGRSSNGGDDDYATIKYDASGTIVWTRIFDNGDIDRATDMGVDAQGNCYVTGRSNNGNDDDFRTLKYSPTGVELFNVPFDFVEDDRADHIAVNPDGTFAIAGRSDGTPSAIINYNYRVIKYSADGAQQWTATYDGTAGNDDIAQDLALSASGEVLITGYSDALSGPSIQNDIVSVLYGASGNVNWTKVYSGTAGHDDETSACIFDSQGNCWIAGHSENTQLRRDALLIQYDNPGTMVSSSSWNGIGDNSDNVREILVDFSGNIYACGYSVGKDTDRDFFLMKMSNTGDTLWTKKITGTLFGSDEESNAIAFDGSGNILVSGYIKNSGTGSDILLQKYSQAGSLLWTATYNGSANESDRSYDVICDGNSNVYITGKTDINNSPIITNDEIFTAKYSSTGNLLWSVIHPGGIGIDRGRSIHLAPTGGVYVCGQSYNGSDEDMLVVKYSTSGALQWAHTFNTGANDVFKTSVLDNSEHVVVAGNSGPIDNTNQSVISLFALDASGNELWTQSYASTEGYPALAEAMSVNSSNEYALVGSLATEAEPNYNYDCITLKYNSSGELLWENIFDSSSALDDIGDAITYDSEGRVLVSCHSNVGATDDIRYQMIILALDGSGGGFLQSAVYAESDTINVCNDLVSLGSKLIAAGSSWGNDTQRDMLFITYDVSLAAPSLPENQATLFPNPAHEEVYMLSDALQANQTLDVYDVTGRLMLSIQSNGLLIDIPIQSLTPGMYTVRSRANGATIGKFQKQ